MDHFTFFSRRRSIFLRRLAAQLLTAVLAVQIGFVPAGLALKVQIDQDIKLRIKQDGQQERIGLLKRGTIVEIPDQFVVVKNGKKDLELTLNNWLRQAGHKPPQTENGPGLFKFDGEKQDYFFPVKISENGLAPGSTLPKELKDTPLYIALGHIVRRGNALVLTEDARVEPITPRQRQEQSPQAVAQRERQRQEMEATSPCAQGLCSRPSETSDGVKNLIRAISPALAASERRRDQVFRRTSNDLDRIDRNFQQSCGFPVSEFTQLVRRRAEQAGVPADILLSLMTQESSGRCYVLNSEADNTQSVGLFQIKSTNASYPRCNSQQKAVLKSLGSANRLATGPRCLENPLLNLEEAIRILKDKRNSVVRGGFDPSKMQDRDLWRLAVSSYNGGQKWVLEARDDLLKFNRIHGTNLDPHKWEDLRLFYFRSWLDPQRRQAMVGKPNAGRSRDNSVANMSYTENVVGRELTESHRPSLASMWVARVETRQ
jgi:hypothetical protein